MNNTYFFFLMYSVYKIGRPQIIERGRSEVEQEDRVYKNRACSLNYLYVNLPSYISCNFNNFIIRNCIFLKIIFPRAHINFNTPTINLVNYNPTNRFVNTFYVTELIQICMNIDRICICISICSFYNNYILGTRMCIMNLKIKNVSSYI